MASLLVRGLPVDHPAKLLVIAGAEMAVRIERAAAIDEPDIAGQREGRRAKQEFRPEVHHAIHQRSREASRARLGRG